MKYLSNVKFIFSDEENIEQKIFKTCTNYRVYIIDSRKIYSFDSLYKVLVKSFDLPEFCGDNPDAVIDFLDDIDSDGIDGFVVLFKNSNCLLKEDSCFVKPVWSSSEIEYRKFFIEVISEIFYSSACRWIEDKSNDANEANRHPSRKMLTIFHDNSLNATSFMRKISKEIPHNDILMKIRNIHGH